MANIKQKLKEYKVLTWVGKQRLNRLFEGKIENFIKHLEEEEDNVLQKQTVYNGPRINPYKSDIRDYGYNFMFLSDLTVSMLKECAKGTKKELEKNIIDIGSGWGATVWKELISGCKSTAYDVSYKIDYTSENFNKYVSGRVPDEISKEKLTKISGDILNIREDHPELIGTYDLVNAQNMIHFFSPKNSLKFAEIVYDLLKPGGKAFVSAESYHLWSKDDPSCMEVYNHNKQNGNKFPGHIEYSKSSIFGNKCSIKDTHELFDTSPYDKKRIAVDHRFDIESFKYIFEEAHLEVQESYYMGFSNKPGVTLFHYEAHPFNKFVGIVVTKPLDSIDDNEL